MKQVVLIIGGRYQSNACGFIGEFEKLGGRVDHILCLKPSRGGIQRLKSTLGFLRVLGPTRLKAWSIHRLCKACGMQQLSTLKARWNYPGENSWDLLEDGFDLFAHAEQRNIPIHFSPALTETVIQRFTAKQPAILPMYGGGILPKAMIRDQRAEFVNAHMGEMPRYRGMNVLEWAIAEDMSPQVAVMVMNEKIDGGDVIWHQKIRVDGAITIADLRRTGYQHCFQAMAQAVFRYQRDPSLRTPQPPGARYYYRMHERIRKIVNAKLLAGSVS